MGLRSRKGGQGLMGEELLRAVSVRDPLHSKVDDVEVMGVKEGAGAGARIWDTISTRMLFTAERDWLKLKCFFTWPGVFGI